VLVLLLPGWQSSTALAQQELVATKPEIWFGIGQTDGILSISFAPDGKTVAFSSGSVKDPVNVLDITIPKPLKVFSADKKATGVAAYSPDGKTLATGGISCPCRLWDTSTWKLVRELKQYSKGTGSLLFAPDGKSLATLEADNRVRLWDLTNDTKPATFSLKKGKLLRCMALALDGKTLAIGDWSSYVELYDLAAPVPFKDLGAKKPRLTIECGGTNLRCLLFAGGGKLLVTGCANENLIQFWNANTGKLERKLKQKARFAYTLCMAVSPDGKTLAIGGTSGYYIQLWDVDTGTIWGKLGPHQTLQDCIAFSRDGSTLVSTIPGFAYVFKVPMKK
jgi:WD40 repeat protein